MMELLLALAVSAAATATEERSWRSGDGAERSGFGALSSAWEGELLVRGWRIISERASFQVMVVFTGLTRPSSSSSRPCAVKELFIPKSKQHHLELRERGKARRGEERGEGKGETKAKNNNNKNFWAVLLPATANVQL